MTTSTATIAEWLLERIAEDEAVAEAALRDVADDGVWRTGDHPMDDERVSGAGITIYDEGGHTPEQATHIARNDPARVLATCKAHRAIVERYQWLYENGDSGNLIEAVRALASIYRDAPGFREEWAG